MPEITAPTNRRRFGYFTSILINGAIMYAVNYLDLWNYIPFLTEKFRDVLWAINLSIGVTIFMYCTFIAFDRRWFRSLMQAMTNVFAFVSLRVFRQVFPLDLAESAAHWANIGLLIMMGAMILSTISELIAAIKHYRKSIHT